MYTTLHGDKKISLRLVIVEVGGTSVNFGPASKPTNNYDQPSSLLRSTDFYCSFQWRWVSLVRPI